MKRSWIGAGMLLVLLAASLAVTWVMDRIHEPVARDLEAAGEAALAGDWIQAEALFQGAADFWKSNETIRACFADHTPMEEIDACFAELAVYCRMKEETAFAASCGEIARRASAMGETHGLVWENLF